MRGNLRGGDGPRRPSPRQPPNGLRDRLARQVGALDLPLHGFPHDDPDRIGDARQRLASLSDRC